MVFCVFEKVCVTISVRDDLLGPFCLWIDVKHHRVLTWSHDANCIFNIAGHIVYAWCTYCV